jgi:hypothetical protein
MAKESGIIRIGNASLEILYDLALDRLIQPGKIALSPFSNSSVQAKISLHLFKSQPSSRIFQAFCGDRHVFQVVQTRLNSFTKEDVPGLACTLRPPARFVRQARRGFEWQP